MWNQPVYLVDELTAVIMNSLDNALINGAGTSPSLVPS
jgi:hypothetical protein